MRGGLRRNQSLCLGGGGGSRLADIGGAQRVAIHRRVVEPGHGLTAARVTRQDPAERLRQRDLLRIEAGHLGEDEPPRLLYVEELRHAD